MLARCIGKMQAQIYEKAFFVASFGFLYCNYVVIRIATFSDVYKIVENRNSYMLIDICHSLLAGHSVDELI